MLNLGNWSFSVRFFSLVGIASMLQNNFLVVLFFFNTLCFSCMSDLVCWLQASATWSSLNFATPMFSSRMSFSCPIFPPWWQLVLLSCSRFCQILCKSESKFMDANQFNRLPSYFLLNYKQPAKWSLWYVLWMSDYKIKKMYFVHWTSPELRG